MELLPAGARTPPAPPRPPAPPTTGWIDRPGGSAPRPVTSRGPLATLCRFLRLCWAELRKVGWPSRHALTQNAGLLFMVVALVTLTIGVLDVAVGALVTRVSG